MLTISGGMSIVELNVLSQDAESFMKAHDARMRWGNWVARAARRCREPPRSQVLEAD